MPLFVVNGFICDVKKDIGETTEQLMDRGYFVTLKKPSDTIEYTSALTQSRIFRNQKYCGCVYKIMLYA